MLWLILLCSLVNLVALAGVAWLALRAAEISREIQHLLDVRLGSNEPDSPHVSTISEMLPAGSSFLPSDQEAAAVEDRMRHDSEQRAGSIRSRRSSTRMRG